MARLLLALAVLVAAPGATFALDEGPWTVTALEGEAQVSLPTRAPQALVPGAKIMPGSEIATDGASRITLSRGNTSMTLSPDSRTQIPFDSDQGQRTTIFQRFGTLLLNVDKRPEQHFEVKTPFLAAVVKGTTFTVGVTGSGSSVHVIEGAVEVGALGSGQVQMVRPGQTATVGKQPNASLDVRQDGSQQGEGGKPAGSDKTGAKDPASGGNGKSAAAPGQNLRITESMGAGELDISGLTDGLVTPAAPRGQALGLAGDTPGNGAVASASKGTAAKAAKSNNGKAFAGSVPGVSSGVPALDVASNGAANRSAGAAPTLPDVGRVVSTVVNPGVGNAGSAPGLALGHGGAVGDAVGNGNGNGLGLGLGNGHGNGHGKGNGG